MAGFNFKSGQGGGGGFRGRGQGGRTQEGGQGGGGGQGGSQTEQKGDREPMRWQRVTGLFETAGGALAGWCQDSSKGDFCTRVFNFLQYVTPVDGFCITVKQYPNGYAVSIGAPERLFPDGTKINQ